MTERHMIYANAPSGAAAAGPCPSHPLQGEEFSCGEPGCGVWHVRCRRCEQDKRYRAWSRTWDEQHAGTRRR